MTATIISALTESTAAVPDRLRLRLATDAGSAGVLDVAYRTVDSPLGSLLLAATPRGLVRVAFEREGFDHVLTALSTAVSPRVLRAPRVLDPAARELDEYFTRQRSAFELALDLQLSHGFRRTVLDRLREVSYGHTTSYGELAAAAGSPHAARAVGSACRTNPLPIVVPCHRVIRSDGRLGEYVGGAPNKRSLLTLEFVA